MYDERKRSKTEDRIEIIFKIKLFDEKTENGQLTPTVIEASMRFQPNKCNLSGRSWYIIPGYIQVFYKGYNFFIVERWRCSWSV